MAESADMTGAMDLAAHVLDKVWGFQRFRGVQERVIRRLLVDGANTLCLMPTGGGKSLCYQVPAICLPGLTVVVSPLIALMKDQVDALRKLNVPAASMDSSLSMQEMSDVKRQLKEGTLKLLYVAPERLNNEMFVSLISEHPVALLAVDESHCISEWGPSFRPDYLKVARFAKEINAERVLALTATATPSVAKDICAGFEVDMEAGLFQTGTFRSNLSLLIKPTFNLASKISLLVPFLQSRRGGAAIVYATTQGDAEAVQLAMRGKGIESKYYHAGVPAQERKDTQDWFLKGEGVVVATIAFGMGIDKANIRQVVHFHIPKTLENYSQEVGRAGRDGLPSTCLMMPCANDLPILESFARGNTPSRNSIRDWLGVVFTADPAPDATLDFSLYEQANMFDIKQNTLGLLYAQLELQFDLLRAVTPFYSSYQIKPSGNNPRGWADVLSDKNTAAAVIRKHWKKAAIWHDMDLKEMAKKSGLDRSELSRQISRWEGEGLCEVKVAGVRNRYMPLQDLPKTAEKIDKMADAMFESMVSREEADVARLYGVCALVRTPECFAHQLATYFGDEKSVPGGQCGSCSFCISKRAIPFDPQHATEIDETKIKHVLAVCGVRDDARFLARLAFGISSPRITKLGLSFNPIFGSCPTADFTKLVKRFEDECEEAGGKNKEVLAPPKASGGGRGGAFNSGGGGAKRTASSGGTRGGARGGAKRGRWDK